MKKVLFTLISAALMISFSACSMSGESSTATNDTAVTASNTSTDNNTEATDLTDGNYDLSFSKRDCDPSYDESSAVKVSFSENSASASSDSVSISGGEVTIKSEGTYIISGTCKDGSIVIDAADNDKIQLVFNGLNLTSSQSAVVVKNADKVFITLADGSKNTISDGSSYTETIDDTNVDSAIFSKCDLTLNGSGTLNVNGNYKHGIVSKDDLVITSGTVNVTSKNCGIDGKDCVKIKDGTITVNSGTDAIRSSNTEKTDTKGFVYISGGNFSLETTNDGIQAASLLRIDGGDFSVATGGGSSNGKTHSDSMGRGMEMFSSSSDSEDSESAKAIKSADVIKINGGSFTINSSDDAFHSNNEIIISDGTLDIKTGDDGVHADSTLNVDGGTINITESYEGLEAGDIVINDGTISIISSDDGLNAAGGSDGNVEQGAFNENSNKSLTINGGYITVNASGDGLDSNGSLTITGGVTLVSGPTDDGNGAIDYDGSAKMTGGVLVALGSSGMAQSVTYDGQCTIMTDIDSQSGDTQFALTDSDGNVIASFKPSKEYSNAVISSPSIKSGETYKIVCGGTISGADSNGYANNGTVSGGTEVTSITMDSDNYSSGGGQMSGPGGQMGGGPGGQTGDPGNGKMGQAPDNGGPMNRQ